MTGLVLTRAEIANLLVRMITKNSHVFKRWLIELRADDLQHLGPDKQHDTAVDTLQHMVIALIKWGEE